MIDIIATYIQPELGWILVIVYGWYEARFGRINQYLTGLDKKLTSTIIVIRALTRTNDRIDTEKVDEYLVDNGTEPSDFIVEMRADGGQDDDE